jgi:hypothetical protein
VGVKRDHQACLRMLVSSTCNEASGLPGPAAGLSGTVQEWGRGEPGRRAGDPAAARAAATRRRRKTAELAARPDVSAPLARAPALDSAPVPLRAELLRSGSSSPRARLGLRRRRLPRRALGQAVAPGSWPALRR